MVRLTRIWARPPRRSRYKVPGYSVAAEAVWVVLSVCSIAAWAGVGRLGIVMASYLDFCCPRRFPLPRRRQCLFMMSRVQDLIMNRCGDW